MESRAGASPARLQRRGKRMAFASSASGSQMSDMNVTPLVDVMLVLLIIFMVTVPMVNYANDINLAKGPVDDKVMPDPLRVHVGAGDTYFLDGQPVTMQQLRERFAVEARRGIVGGTIEPNRQPAVQLTVDADAEYETVAQVLAGAKNAHLVRVGFAEK